MEQGLITKKIDDKEMAKTYGYYNFKRRTLPFNPNNKEDIGWNSVDK